MNGKGGNDVAALKGDGKKAKVAREKASKDTKAGGMGKVRATTTITIITTPDHLVKL